MKLIWIGLLLLALVACESADDGDNNNDEDTNPTDVATAVGVPELPTDLRLQSETQYEQLRQTHSAISVVWEDLADGETAECGAVYDTLEPQVFSDEHPVQSALRDATLEINAAVDLWEQECQNPRADVPQTLINDALLIVRAAGVALTDAESYLAE